MTTEPAKGASLAHQALYSILATGVQGLLRLLYSILVGRFGSPTLLGHANTALSLGVFSSYFWAVPAGTAGTKYVAMAKEDPDTAVDPAELDEHRLMQAVSPAQVARAVAVQAAIVSVVVAVLCGVIARVILGFDALQSILVVLLCWVYSVYSVTRGIRFGRNQAKNVALWDGISAVVALLVLGAVLLTSANPLILVPAIVSYGMFALANWPRGPVGNPRLPARQRREIRRFIGFFALGAVASGGLVQLSQLAAYHYTGSAGAGTYAAALSLATPASMLSSALGSVLVPRLAAAAAAGDRAAVHTQSDLVTRQLITVFVAIFGSLTVISPTLMLVLYGRAYSSSAAVLSILLVAVLFLTVGVSANMTLNATVVNGARTTAILNVIGLVIGVASWPLLVLIDPLPGVAAGLLLGAVVPSIGALLVVWRTERHRWAGLVLRLLGGIAALIGLALLTRNITGGLGVLAQLGAALVFLAGWVIVSRKDVTTLLGGLGGMLRKRAG